MHPVVTLDIEQIGPGVYEVHCVDRPDSPTVHCSISDAIRDYGNSIPRDYAHFVEVRYGGVSLGTQAVVRLSKESEVMASELIELVACVHRSIEEIEHLRKADGTTV